MVLQGFTTAERAIALIAAEGFESGVGGDVSLVIGHRKEGPLTLLASVGGLLPFPVLASHVDSVSSL